MDSIAVTKPDMAVMKRDRLGLSLFGLLSLAFGDEVRTRSDWQTGLYREVPLDLLEEEEQQPVSGESPAVQLNFDLKVVLETLKKEQQHADQRQRKAAERILERVYLLERQVREHTPVPTQVNIQLGAPQAAAGRAAQAALQAAGTEVRQPAGAAVQAASKTVQRRDGRAPRRLTGAQAAAALRQVHRAGGSKAGGTFSQERLGRLAAPLTPVSWSTAAPSGDGWKPQWQEEHPGFVRKETQNGGQTGAGGSILLPDQLRRRREQALARAAAQEQGLPQEEMAHAEQQFARAIEASVQRTLARQQSGAPQTDGDAPAQTAAQAAVQQIHAAADAAEAERTAAVLPPQNNRPAAPAELVYHTEAEPAAPTADRPQADRPAGDNITAGRAQTARAEQSIAQAADRAKTAGTAHQMAQPTDDVKTAPAEQSIAQAADHVKAAEQTAAASHQPANGAIAAPAAAHTAAAERPAAQTEGAKTAPAGTQAEAAAESGAPTALPASGAQAGQPAAPAELVYRAETELAAPTADRPQAAQPAGDNAAAGRAQTARGAEQTAAASHQPAQLADGVKAAPAAVHTAAAERPETQTGGAKATSAGAQAEAAAESGAPTALPASGAQAGQPAAPAELVYRAETEPAAPTADRPQAAQPAGENTAAGRRQAVQTGRAAADTKAAPQTKAGQAASPARPAAQTPVQAKRAQPAWETPAQPQQELVHAPQDAAHTIRPQASQIASVRPMPLHHAAERTAAARPMEPFAYAPAQPAVAPTPAEEGAGLTYLPVQTPAQEQHRTPQPAGQTQMTSDYVRSLPEWAQRFLQQPSETGGAAVQTAQHSAAGRKAAAPPAGQIEWTAPNAVPQGAHIVFRHAVKPKEQQTAPQPVRLSDGELRRAADKVYRMIEDRLRKELRRSGR